MTPEQQDLINAALAKAEALGRIAKPGQPIKPPGIVQQAVNFATSAARHVMAGLPMVEPEEKERRLAICRACEHFEADGERCRKCGCTMPTKTGWKLERCPDSPPRW